MATDNGIDSALAADVRAGLTKFPKRLSSRFFYDAEGSRLFQQIMHLPEYYLTRCEYEILETYATDLHRLAGTDGLPFDLIELGAGDGLKTKVLLTYFCQQPVPFTYLPIDISKDALDQLTADLRQQYPNLVVEPQHTDYFQALAQLSQASDRRKIILFLGSNVGNFTTQEIRAFYKQLFQNLNPGDRVVTGFDLKKSPAIIQAAYDDSQGVTRAFNLNLLQRINRELEANFDLDAFDHVVGYNSASGEMCSYLASRCAQQVYIGVLDMTVSFFAGETIRTEISRKFDRQAIEQLARHTGFTIRNWFADDKGYFADVVFER